MDERDLVVILAIVLSVVMMLGFLIILMAWLQPRPPGRGLDHDREFRSNRPMTGIDILDDSVPKGDIWRPHLDGPFEKEEAS